MSTQQLQFVAFQPFALLRPTYEYSQDSQESQFSVSRSMDAEEVEQNLEKSDQEESQNSNSAHSTVTSKHRPSNKCQNQNIVKQIFITIKRMINQKIPKIQAYQEVKIVLEKIWKIIYQRNNKITKRILQALFDCESFQNNKKLLKLEGFGSVLDSCSDQNILAALEVLRNEIIDKMTSLEVRKHLFQRKVERKERLAANIEYFIQYELAIGKISPRFTGKGMEKIQEMISQANISSYLTLEEETQKEINSYML